MNIDYINPDEIETYVKFLGQDGGIKELAKLNRNKLEELIKNKKEIEFGEVEKNKANQEYIEALKIEFRSLKYKLKHPLIYFTLKKSENKHYSPIDYFLDLCLSN